MEPPPEDELDEPPDASVTVSLAPFDTPLQVIVYVYTPAAAGVGTFCWPLMYSGPDHASDAAQLVAFCAFHVIVDVLPSATLVGDRLTPTVVLPAPKACAVISSAAIAIDEIPFMLESSSCCLNHL